MDCPVCGEELPLDSAICSACGNRADQFFLTEEVRTSRVSKRTMKVPSQKRSPTPRKEGRDIAAWKITVMTAAVTGLALTLVAVVFMMIGGKGKPQTPEEVVGGYYEALSKGDFGAMKSLFAGGFLPRAEQAEAVENAVDETRYEVTGPDLRTLTDDGKTARVAIQSLQVKTSVIQGLRIKTSLGEEDPVVHDVAEALKIPQRQNHNLLLVVNLVNEGGGAWMIADRPMGGWLPENLWLIGEPREP